MGTNSNLPQDNAQHNQPAKAGDHKPEAGKTTSVPPTKPVEAPKNRDSK
ncbi:MAG: hypothetical protein ACOYK8_03060 [Alphaproteobacteria bacterium]